MQREGEVIHVVARSFTDLTPELLALADGHDLGDGMLAPADEARTGPPPPRDEHERRRHALTRRAAYDALPSGRNFH